MDANHVLIAMSAAPDGSMSKAVSDDARLRNRKNFLASHDLSVEQTILVHLEYGGSDYRRYFTVRPEWAGSGITRPSEVISDALFTTTANVALLLPVADCIAAVVYDSARQVLGLAHLGRHNLAQQGGQAVVEYMIRTFDSNPAHISVWLSAAAGGQNYPLHDFENRSLHEVALEQLRAAGIPDVAITIDARDTTTDTTLFSHSAFLRGTRPLDGRQAVVAMMRSQ
jgi:copper oxidase (laccase) domain-containing protein